MNSARAASRHTLLVWPDAVNAQLLLTDVFSVHLFRVECCRTLLILKTQTLSQELALVGESTMLAKACVSHARWALWDGWRNQLLSIRFRHGGEVKRLRRLQQHSQLSRWTHRASSRRCHFCKRNIRYDDFWRRICCARWHTVLLTQCSSPTHSFTDPCITIHLTDPAHAHTYSVCLLAPSIRTPHMAYTIH